MTVRWQFYDLYSTQGYTFEVNPNEGGSPSRKKNVMTKPTSAPGGRTLVFEGADEPRMFSWSGTLLSQAQLGMFQTWFDKRHQIQLTDDLGRVSVIHITKLQVKRERAVHHHWKHTYTIDATELNWP